MTILARFGAEAPVIDGLLGRFEEHRLARDRGRMR
jgi:hypothetical protein